MLKRKRLIFISGIVIICAIVFSVYLRSLYMIPVVMYHSVTPDASPENRLQVSVATFSRQMQFLKSRHYNVVSLEAAGEMIRDKKRIPPHTVALTFDDGYKDNYIYAYPVLKRLGLPATIFIVVNEVGRPEGDRLSWDEIRAMQDSGIIMIGSHTLDHYPYLPEIKTEEELRRQIFDSKKILEAKLGSQIDLFSYPAGRFNPHVRDLVRQAGYTFAVATGLGKSFSNQDLYLIKRVRVGERDSLFDFWVKVSGYYNSFRSHNKK